MDGTEIETNELNRTGLYRSSDIKFLGLKVETVLNWETLSCRRGKEAIAGQLIGTVVSSCCESIAMNATADDWMTCSISLLYRR